MKGHIVTVRGVAKYPLQKRSYIIRAVAVYTAASRAIRCYNADEQEINPKRKRMITEYSITIKKA